MTEEELYNACRVAWKAVCYAQTEEEIDEAIEVHCSLVRWWKEVREAKRSKSQ